MFSFLAEKSIFSKPPLFLLKLVCWIGTKKCCKFYGAKLIFWPRDFFSKYLIFAFFLTDGFANMLLKKFSHFKKFYIVSEKNWNFSRKKLLCPQTWFSLHKMYRTSSLFEPKLKQILEKIKWNPFFLS